MMVAVRAPLATVTPTMAAWSHLAAAQTVLHSGEHDWLLLRWAWMCAILAVADDDKQQFSAAGYLNCGCIWQNMVSPRICSEHISVCSVAAAAAAEADRLWWEGVWRSKQLILLGQQVITLVEFAGWAEAIMNTTATSVTDCCWCEQDMTGKWLHLVFI